MEKKVYLLPRMFKWPDLQIGMAAPVRGPGCGFMLLFGSMEELLREFPDVSREKVMVINVPGK